MLIEETSKDTIAPMTQVLRRRGNSAMPVIPSVIIWIGFGFIQNTSRPTRRIKIPPIQLCFKILVDRNKVSRFACEVRL